MERFYAKNVKVLATTNDNRKIVCYTDIIGYGKSFENGYGLRGTEFIDFDIIKAEIADGTKFITGEDVDKDTKIVNFIEVFGNIDWDYWEDIFDEVNDGLNELDEERNNVL